MKERGILSPADLRKPLNKVVYGFMLLCLAVMIVTMLYPIAMTMFNGLKSNPEVNSFPPHFFPQEWHWENFIRGWQFINLPGYLKNTMFVFLGSLVVTVLVLGLAAFSISRIRVPFGRAIYFFILMTLFIPASSYMIPNFVNLKELGLLNTFWAFWLPAGASAYYFLLIKNFFDGIHPEIFEAARIDGASDWTNFIRIAIPLSVPIFATLSIFIFSTAWNDWFWPSLVMQTEDKYTLATAIYKYVVNARSLDTNVKFTILFMAMIPPIFVFLVFQKFIMRSVNLSAVKG